jgi:hypothetical protein
MCTLLVAWRTLQLAVLFWTASVLVHAQTTSFQFAWKSPVGDLIERLSVKRL